jgi:hypothetical protein
LDFYLPIAEVSVNAPLLQRVRELTVEKVSAERALCVFAHCRPWSYGLASVTIALAARWGASAAFRRA